LEWPRIYSAARDGGSYNKIWRYHANPKAFGAATEAGKGMATQWNLLFLVITRDLEGVVKRNVGNK
jgi:hypothetical protein